MLEQNNAVETTTTTTTTTIPTTTLPNGYEQQHFVLSEFGRRQTKERLNTHESGQSQSDPERRTLPRAPYTLGEAHGEEELEKKASARHHQSSKKSSTKNTNVLLRAGSASTRKTSMSGKAAGPRTKAKTKSQAPLMKTKTSAWWRWVGEAFRRVCANDVARVLPTKNWRDDQALKIPPIGNRNGMMLEARFVERRRYERTTTKERRRTKRNG